MVSRMIHRPLGNTGLLLSPIGFGAFKIGRNQKTKYARGYDLPDDSGVQRLLNGVLDLGINLIDTAPAYGRSEERIGQAIAHRRREYVLSTKTGETFEDGRSMYDFSRAATLDSVHRSLRRLRTDVLDIVLIHSDGDDLRILNHSDVVATLQELRSSGLVRFIGLSGKTVAGALAAMNWADVLMIEYHALDRSHEPVLGEAHRRGVGVLIKKPLASGRLPARQAIPELLADGRIASLVIGGLDLEHVRENVELAGRAGGSGISHAT